MKLLDMLASVLLAIMFGTGYTFQRVLMMHVPPYLAISVEALIISLCMVPFYPRRPASASCCCT